MTSCLWKEFIYKGWAAGGVFDRGGVRPRLCAWDRGLQRAALSALNRAIPGSTRELEVEPVLCSRQSDHALLHREFPVAFTPPTAATDQQSLGHARMDEQIVMIQRTVNYSVTEDGASLQYQ